SSPCRLISLSPHRPVAPSPLPPFPPHPSLLSPPSIPDVHRLARNFFSIAALSRSQHSQRLRPIHLWHASRTEAPVASACFLSNRSQDLLRCSGNFIDANTHRVVNRICNDRRNRQKRTLPYFLCSKGTGRDRLFDEKRFDFAHLERSRTLVFEHRRNLVHYVSLFPINHLLHQRFAESHVDAAFNLTQHKQRVYRAADVVSQPHSIHDHDACL